jgi:hypothetical protein
LHWWFLLSYGESFDRTAMYFFGEEFIGFVDVVKVPKDRGMVPCD